MVAPFFAFAAGQMNGALTTTTALPTPHLQR